MLTQAEAARVTGEPGRVDRVLVDGGPGPDELRERIADVTPASAEALTAADLAERRAEQARESLGVVRGALSAFAAVVAATDGHEVSPATASAAAAANGLDGVAALSLRRTVIAPLLRRGAGPAIVALVTGVAGCWDVTAASAARLP